MTKTIATVGFDYDGIEKDAKGKLTYLAGQIRKSTKGHVEHALEMGRHISDANDVLCKVGCEGKFAEWVRTECGFSKQTAYNYMNAYARFGDEQEHIGQFTAEAIYVLSADDVPEAAIKEVLKLADKGQRVNRETAKETLDKFRDASRRASNSKSLGLLPPKTADEPSVEDDEKGPQGERRSEEWTPPPGVTQFNDKFEPTAEPDAFDLAAKQAPYDEMLNHITQISRVWGEVTKDERDGVYALDKRQRVEVLLRDLRGPIAQARPHSVCEHCEGKGCKKCQNCGWWPRSVVEGMRK